jgi:sentrin-specific protease 1
MSLSAGFYYVIKQLIGEAATSEPDEFGENAKAETFTKEELDELVAQKSNRNERKYEKSTLPLDNNLIRNIRQAEGEAAEDKFLYSVCVKQQSPFDVGRTPYSPVITNSHAIHNQYPADTPYKYTTPKKSQTPIKRDLTDDSEDTATPETVRKTEQMINQQHMTQYGNLRSLVELYVQKNESLAKSQKKKRVDTERRSLKGRKVSAENEAEIQQILKNKDQNKVMICINNIDLRMPDLVRLNPRQWLNDELVNCFISILTDENKKPENKDYPRCHFFNSFFYLMLLDHGRGYNYSKVRTWTKNIDIYSLELVILPVHMNNNHWCLACMNMRDKRIEYYDSMGAKNPLCIKSLHRYLNDESMNKRGYPFDATGWTVYTPGSSIPQQNNIYDCGVFMCQFAEHLGSGHSIDLVDQADMQYYRKRMFLEITHNQKDYQ